MASPKEIFDSASGETGTEQEFARQTSESDITALVQCEIGSGDTVVLEGKLDSTLSYVIIATFTADTLVEVSLPPYYRARRTVDGASGDSQVWVLTKERR